MMHQLKMISFVQIECAYNHVDFCNASALGNLGSVSDYMPPKIWRFLPAGDLLVDIMGSRDLDSPLPQRELDAVNEWVVYKQILACYARSSVSFCSNAR